MEEWQSRLDAGDREAAWNLFLARYRTTILAVIRRLVGERADVMDVFSTICVTLAADDCARLRQYSHRMPAAPRLARSAVPRDADRSAAAWLVVVVRNLTIDWIRGERGRRRVIIPQSLTPLQREIFAARCIERSSVAEAYELLRVRIGLLCSYGEFLREARATHLAAPCPDREVREAVPWDDATVTADVPHRTPGEVADLATRLLAALGEHPADVRLAIELYVLGDLPASDVARIVRWPNAKTVYNRVSRALDAVRRSLAARGITAEDL